MRLPSLLPLYAAHPAVKALSAALRQNAAHHLHLDGLQGSAAPVALAALAEGEAVGRPFLLVLPDEEEAGYFYHDLSQLLGQERVLFFPSAYRRAVKYAQRDAANEILRTEVLDRLAQIQAAAQGDESKAKEKQSQAKGKNSKAKKAQPATGEAGNADCAEALYIVTFPDALTERIAPPAAIEQQTVRLRRGEEVDVSALAERLLKLGFRRRDYVYEPGEFALRGSIVDVFSFASEYPFRIDFFGNEVDTLRTFEVQTQLSREQLTEVSIVPNIETAGHALVPFPAALPRETVLCTRDYAYLLSRAEQVWNEGFARQALAEQEALAAATSEMDAAARREALSRESLLTPPEALQRGLDALTRVTFSAQAAAKGEAEAVLHFHTAPQQLFHKNFSLLRDDLLAHAAAGRTVYVLSDSPKQTERLATILAEMAESEGTTAPPFTPVAATLHAGFTDSDLRAAFYTDHQIFDRFHKYALRSDRARDAKMALSLKELMQFSPGDFVVHIDHGVGRFAGLVRIPASDGTQQEAIKLTFQNDDVVFVSIHSLHKVSKYKGREGEPPQMSRLGTGAWERMKERTKKKIKDIARDLIRLYSQRREAKGFAFSPDSYMQQALEAGFAYEDTPDQLRVTREVKADMESARPMDRLVCGDVGFGKTEIAVRAALKAAADGKQVAVMVPTTVLALQHYKTFSQRLRDFPVRVDYLSRARTAAQTSAVLRGLADGSIDIVVGTHKLIGRGVHFKDLGLLIIDEEQKFGVSVKEKLRTLKVNLDTLTMSATPIPRTLQFSLMGARDFSVIQTPPPNRRPIRTEVHTFSHEVIADAVNFELSRDGQAFIVTNRISALGNLAELLRKYVPDARVAIGHGQMPPAQLEQVILDFANHDYNVLLSTTIVENGIDIPNANTIIIDAAHHFGLSDLHQMRGRVGRGSRKAFCYLLAPPLSLLPDDARRRLEAIENFADLGAGIHIAMQDLDIRGAGNLLGAEQSGFIADLGYETYQKILSQAVNELKAEEFADLFATEAQHPKGLTGDDFVDETAVECDLRAYLPETYVPGAAERMMLYRELDAIGEDRRLDEFRARLHDRFGALPPEADELLRIPALRRLARRAGAERVALKGGRMTLTYIGDLDSPFYRSQAFERTITFATANYRRCRLSEEKGKRRMHIAGVKTVETAVAVLQQLVGNKEQQTA